MQSVPCPAPARGAVQGLADEQWRIPVEPPPIVLVAMGWRSPDAAEVDWASVSGFPRSSSPRSVPRIAESA